MQRISCLKDGTQKKLSYPNTLGPGYSRNTKSGIIRGARKICIQSKQTLTTQLFCGIQYPDLLKLAISIVDLHEKEQYWSLITQVIIQLYPSIAIEHYAK